ncbi:MAG: hypothetical protein M1828_002068 [Chrysothrix sp. TS-e1954]|nr:MAG: hypothetical protein M1828_002068 [Chrysothrix sp. TS-e1954]
MERPSSGDADNAPTKPVSSLRSQFESLNPSRSTTPVASNGTNVQRAPHSLLQAMGTGQRTSTPSLAPEFSRASPMPSKPVPSIITAGSQQVSPQPRTKSPMKRRPVSMLYPPSHSSPSRSSYELSRANTLDQDAPDLSASHESLRRRVSKPIVSDTVIESPPPSAVGHGPLQKLDSPSLNALDIVTNTAEQRPRLYTKSVLAAPPVVNRAAKPHMPATTALSARGETAEPRDDLLTTRTSSFNPPAGSDHSSSEKEIPPRIPVQSKPVRNAPSDIIAPRVQASLSRQTIPNRRPTEPQDVSVLKSTATHHMKPVSRGREEEKAPSLPPRQGNIGPKISVTANPALDLPQRSSALTQGFSSKKSNGLSHQVQRESTSVQRSQPESQIAPRSRAIPLPPRQAATMRSESFTHVSPRDNDARLATARESSASQGPKAQPGTSGSVSNASSTLPELPLSSNSNRRPPNYRDGPRIISTGYETKLLDVCGEFVCTSGILTRVWSVLTGKLLLSLTQAESVKITAMAFKPARNHEEEGTRLWLGTNWGELQEVDIPSKKIVATNVAAHNRHEIIKIHRHAAQLWTIDDEGKLYVWPADTTGSPNLEVGIQNPKLPRGRTSSVAVGARLWYACSKDIRSFAPSSKPETSPFQLSDGAFAQSTLGEISSGAILSTQPDHVYFGHSDGRISVWSRKDFKLRRIVHISNYKVSCLIGAGSYLWAGLNTGKICVYDTTSRPWMLKKAWQPHNGPVTAIVVDRSSIWKLDRLQVLSLGADSVIGVWDGMLEDDWLESDMQSHEVDFCTIRDMTALVMTWNAGASGPQDLRYEDRDRNFFRELRRDGQLPDLLVFGLQELVDLEDKALTAKSFFKSRAKDSYGQEQLGSVYRAWRDYFTKRLQEYYGSSEQYTLIHTASLVGLFTCIFVKSSLRSRVRDLHTAEVKTGMGGLHGNKGALIVRFKCNDSSLCFVNCHLAAGQTQTANRNQDVAAILEYSHLPSVPSTGPVSDSYVRGGDGSMVLDHELCVLNGDLNYRIDTMTRDTIITTLKSNSLSKLLERDQLLLSQRRNPGFSLRDLDEGQISFAPTYKYDVGTVNYDTGDKRRPPAWCDRILFRGADKIKQLDYQRHEVLVSDHRPVSSLFVLKIKTISRDKRADCWQACLKRYEKFKSHVSTQAKLDYLTHVFGLSPAEAKRKLEA